MKNTEKILNYINGGLTENKKKSFEEELISNKDLAHKFEEVKLNLNKLKNLSEVEFNNDYAKTVSAKIINSQNKKATVWNRKTVFAFGTTIIFLIFTFILFENKINNEDYFQTDNVLTINGIDSLIPVFSNGNNGEERTIMQNTINVLGEELSPEIYIYDFSDEEAEELINNLIAKSIL